MKETMSTQEFKVIYDRYKELLFRIAFTYMKNQPDTEDILQEVFLKRISGAPTFASEEHEKRWMIRVTINLCKNALTTFWNRNRASMTEAMPIFYENMEPEKKMILDAVLDLPAALKAPVYLYYYEGYRIKEISEMLNVKESTVKMRLKRAKEQLKLYLTKEGIVDECG